MDRLVKEYIMLDPATAAWAEQVKNGTARCVGREVINMDGISETVSAISVDSMMIEIRRIDGSVETNEYVTFHQQLETSGTISNFTSKALSKVYELLDLASEHKGVENH